MLYLVIIAVFAADQLLKWWIRSHMTIDQLISIIPHVAYLFYTLNSGGAFSILPHARWLFLTVSVVVIAGGIYANQRFRPGPWSTIALGLVLGGALGNMADRAVSGLVTDYMYLKVINFPVFNLADASIDVGIAIWIIRSIASDRRHRREVSRIDHDAR